MGRAIAIKAERRQIRRVLGDDAARQVKSLMGEVMVAQAQIADLGVWVKQREQDSRIQAERFLDLNDRYHTFTHRGFWSRLRWLVTGR